MTTRFITFQHLPWEGPGMHLIRAAENQNVQLEVVKVWREPIPDLSPYDGLIVLGGDPNVDQEEVYSFLRAEKEAIRRSIEKDRPYLGFCLGHQLLADALGARVGENFCRSVGFIRGQITKEGRHHPVFENLPNTLPLFKWHAQAVLMPMPKHIEILVTSSDCVVEALSVSGRPHILGFQFDNHAGTLEDVSRWLEEDVCWLSLSPSVDATSMLEDAEKLEKNIGEQFEILFKNFLDLLT